MLGEQFNFDYNASRALDENIIQGEKYRFTVLSERLIRLEYSESGVFENRPTELVWYRNTPKVAFDLKDRGSVLEITTSYFKLTYRKEKPFAGSKFNSMANLKVKLLNSDKIWFYNHPEIRNYGAPGTKLSDSIKSQKGLYSGDGFATIDETNSKVFTQEGSLVDGYSEHIDIYLFMYLKDYSLCLQDYFTITGYPTLLPRYAFGNWWSKNEKYNDYSLKNLIDDFSNNDVPISVLLLDRPWHISYNNKTVDHCYTWNKDYFKKPVNMINYIHQNKMQIGLNVNPLNGIYPLEENYEQIKNNLTPNENGIIPFNVLDSRTISVYLNLLVHPLTVLGVDFYWLDETKNMEKLFYLTHYHYRDVINDKRSLVLTGMIKAAHRYPVCYSGKADVSWENLKQLPFYNSAAANIGMSYLTYDVGGYSEGTEDNELYTRYVQLGVFSPILKFGSEGGIFYKREPWKWGIKTSRITSEYLNLRHKLIPYIYTEAHKFYKYGQPLIMPIYYTKPEYYDDEIYKNEYYFGSQFFIAPIVSKKDYVMNRVVHKFYLPSGVWYDFITGKKLVGNKEYVSFFKEEEYPIFVKEGAILPLGTNENLNDTSNPSNLEIQIFPGKSNSYTLYEDDGITNAYKNLQCVKTQIDFNYEIDNYTLILKTIEGKNGILKDRRNYKFIFRNTKRADIVDVYYNDTKLPTKSYVSGSNFVIEINDVPSMGQISLNIKGKNLQMEAERILRDIIEEIISDLQIETKLKILVDNIMFSDMPHRKKRVEIRKLTKQGLDSKFIKLFFKLLEFLEDI